MPAYASTATGARIGQDAEDEDPRVGEECGEGQEQGEDGAGGAHNGDHRPGRGVVDEDGRNPGSDAADEVVQKELRAAHALLELDPEEEEGEHVEEDVAPSPVHEHVGHDLPPCARLEHVGGEQPQVVKQSLPIQEPEEEDDHVHHDEDDRRVEVAVAQRAAQNAWPWNRSYAAPGGVKACVRPAPVCYLQRTMKGKADYYWRKSKEEGYPARSVFKLQEIQEKYKPLEPGDQGPGPRRLAGKLEPVHPGHAGGRRERDGRGPEPAG